MTKRVIACLAALTLALSLLPVTALADEPEVQTPNTTVEVSGGESGASQPKGTTTGGTEETGSTEGEGTGSGDESQETAYVAQIGDTKYDTLDAAIAAAKDDDTITVLKDCGITTGMDIDGKNLTIQGADAEKRPIITMTEVGIHANESKLTFKDCVLNISVKDNPSTGSGATCNLIDDSDLTLDHVRLTLTPTEETGAKSGMYLYQKTSLYIINGSVVKVSGFDGANCSGIYSDESEYRTEDGKNERVIQVTGKSSLTVENCSWNGMTVNPLDILIDGNSNIFISNCGINGGRGGLGCYYGALTINNNSTLTTDNNKGRSWGTFVKELYMDGTSTLSSCGNTAMGIEIGGKGEIPAGAKVLLNNNAQSGLVSYTGSNYWFGDVTVYDGANVTIQNNGNGIFVMQGGKLNMACGTVTNNGGMATGGGLWNRGGTVVLGGKVDIYNNHATTAGDDIYSDSYTKNKVLYPATITIGSTGNWTLNSDPDCGHHIDGWYYDGQEKTVEGENGATEIAVSPRWNGKTTMGGNCVNKNADAYYELYTPSKEAVSAPLALKAAHGYLNNNPPVIRDQYYTVTVNYVDVDGNTVAPSYTTGSLKSGTAYDVTAQDAIAIPGYTYKTTTGDPTTGTLNGNKVVTVVYTKTADIGDGNTPTDPGDPGSDIDDPNTPTSPAEPPKTGDMMPLFAGMAAVSAAAIMLLSRKRKEA